MIPQSWLSVSSRRCWFILVFVVLSLLPQGFLSSTPAKAREVSCKFFDHLNMNINIENWGGAYIDGDYIRFDHWGSGNSITVSAYVTTNPYTIPVADQVDYAIDLTIDDYHLPPTQYTTSYTAWTGIGIEADFVSKEMVVTISACNTTVSRSYIIVPPNLPPPTRDPYVRPADPVVPVVFVPGIGASYLDNADASVLPNRWPGLSYPQGKDIGYPELSLDPTDPLSRTNIVATDAIRKIAVPGMPEFELYDTLLKRLVTDGGYVEYKVDNKPERRKEAGCDVGGQSNPKPTLFVFAYDWREDNAQNADLLADYIACVHRFHPNSKVDILAHSMGGLVSRRYILEHPGTIRRLVTIATPWLGAPKAINVIETGTFNDEDPSFNNGLDRLAKFWPGGHQLLPSSAYFALGGQPLLGVRTDPESGLPVYRPYSYSEMIATLDSRYPQSTVGTNSRTFMNMPGQQDFSADSPDVTYYPIIGVQSAAATMGTLILESITQCHADANTLICMSPTSALRVISWTRGDNTVPRLSAVRCTLEYTWCAEGTPNLNAPTGYFFVWTDANPKKVSHNGLLTNPFIQEVVMDDLLSPDSGPNPEKMRIVSEQIPSVQQVTESSLEGDDVYYITATGAVTMTTSDIVGNTTQFGPLTRTDIPGVIYRPLGSQRAVLITPTYRTITVTLETNGNPFSLEIVSSNGITPTQAIRYQDVTVPSRATLSITPLGVGDLRQSNSVTAINAQDDSVIAPTNVVTGTNATDLLPPAVRLKVVQISGQTVLQVQANDDTGTGVAKIYYSLDDIVYHRYTGSVVVNSAQLGSITAFAEDRVGNRSGVARYMTGQQSASYLPLIQR